MKRTKAEKGITLIALIITIIVLLILAVVTIQAVQEHGIIGYAKKAQTEYDKAAEEENAALQQYADYIDQHTGETTPTEPGGGGENDGSDLKFKINGATVTEEDIKSNVQNYLGKKVTNYKGQTSVTIESETYTVSPEYRLYYIDFDGKYGEKGTIYLKAECTSNNKALPTTETSTAETEGIKIKALNPELYKKDVTAPSESNNNMKAVIWLTNTRNWANLADTSMQANINYVVGAPSLEMMMDSYNMYYNLTEPTPNTEWLDASSDRVRLFYKYTQGTSGYLVGPCRDETLLEPHDYYDYTSNYSVKTDSIDTMYYPGDNQCYWLASPSADNSNDVMNVISEYRRKCEQIHLYPWLRVLPASFS